jgi:hypothetical protein
MCQIHDHSPYGRCFLFRNSADDLRALKGLDALGLE